MTDETASQAPRHAAVIDIGKSNAKLAVVDMESLAEIAVRTRPNAVLTGGPYPHYDVDGIWAFILEELSALHRAHRIDAVAATTHGAACVLLDRTGEAALPVLDYEHDGPDSLAAEYDALRPPFAQTGSPRLPLGLNLGAQIFWQERRFPRAFAEVATILMYPQYWSFRLCGVAANEITSLGVHTDLWNPASRDYSAMVDWLGWRPLLAPLRKAADSLAPIRPEIAALTGLAADTPVHCGIHDSNASLLPHLVSRQPPFSVVSTGTWVIAMAIGGRSVELAPERDTLINVDAFGAPVPSARFMGGRERALLLPDGGTTATADDAATVLAGGVMLLPSVQAGSGPFPQRQAEWRGGEPVAPGPRQAAVSLYLALMTTVCLDLIGAQGPVIAEGPLAADPLYLRMLAAATGRSVLPSPSRGTGTSIGAALLTSQAARFPAQETAVTCADAEWAAYAARWLALTRA
jgi:sugar (pentulose or hexulose) kinase